MQVPFPDNRLSPNDCSGTNAAWEPLAAGLETCAQASSRQGTCVDLKTQSDQEASGAEKGTEQMF